MAQMPRGWLEQPPNALALAAVGLIPRHGHDNVVFLVVRGDLHGSMLNEVRQLPSRRLPGETASP